MKNIELSIVIPVYQVEKYISECIYSILQIQNILYEIIIIDDGTIDRSIEIAKSVLNGRTNVKFLSQTNRGLSAARNTGLKAATGKYIWFVDSDDYIDSSGIEKVFSENTNVDIIINDFTKVNKQSIQTYTSLLSKNKIYSGIECIEQYYLRQIYTVVWRNLYRREFLLKNELTFFEGILYEDVEWSPRVITKAKSVKYSNTNIYYYRTRCNSIVNSNFTPKHYNSIITVEDSLSSFIKTENLTTNQRKVIQDSISYFLLMAIAKNPTSDDSAIIKFYNLENISIKYRIIRIVFRISPKIAKKIIQKKIKAL